MKYTRQLLTMSFLQLTLCLLSTFTITSALTCTGFFNSNVTHSCSGASNCAAMYQLIGEKWVPYQQFCFSRTSSQSDGDQWTWLSSDIALHTCTSSDYCNNEQPPAPALIPHRPQPLPTLTCNQHSPYDNGTCTGQLCSIIQGMNDTKWSSCHNQDSFNMGYCSSQDKQMCVSTYQSAHGTVIDCFCYTGNKCNNQALLQWGKSQLEQTSGINCYVGYSHSSQSPPPTATAKGRYCYYYSYITGSQQFNQDWKAIQSTAALQPIWHGCLIFPINNVTVVKQCFCDTDYCNNPATVGLSGAGSISKSSNFQQSNVRVEDLHGIPWIHNPIMNMKKRMIEKLFPSK